MGINAISGVLIPKNQYKHQGKISLDFCLNTKKFNAWSIDELTGEWSTRNIPADFKRVTFRDNKRFISEPCVDIALREFQIRDQDSRASGFNQSYAREFSLNHSGQVKHPDNPLNRTFYEIVISWQVSIKDFQKINEISVFIVGETED